MLSFIIRRWSPRSYWLSKPAICVSKVPVWFALFPHSSPYIVSIHANHAHSPGLLMMLIGDYFRNYEIRFRHRQRLSTPLAMMGYFWVPIRMVVATQQSSIQEDIRRSQVGVSCCVVAITSSALWMRAKWGYFCLHLDWQCPGSGMWTPLP